MPRYQVFKKHRARDGHITRELYIDQTAKGVNDLIRNYSRAGAFTSGNYVAFRILKGGKLERAGKPFTV